MTKVVSTAKAVRNWFICGGHQDSECIPRRYNGKAIYHNLDDDTGLVECSDGAVFATYDISGSIHTPWY